ncbi:MAG: signal peptidase I [Anaerovoracaceae bacterium]|jgi:signal peptidase I
MKENTKATVKELAKDVAIAVAIVVGISVFVSPTLVKETSMEPNVEPNDYLLMSKQAYRFGKMHRGDVVIFRSDLETPDGHKKLLIKRVIGLPGDILTITNGEVWLNGSKVKEDYIAEGGTPGEIYNLKIPKGQIFVMGDHRVVSVDSRKLGTIDKKSIVGKAVFRLFPFNKIGAI